MGKIFASIKGRALQYVDFKGITKRGFCSAVGISESNLKGNSAKSEFGGEVVVKILSTYNDLSAEWLLRGEGEMLLKSDLNRSELSIKDSTGDSYKNSQLVEILNQELKQKQKTIESQARTIQQLLDLLEQKQEDLIKTVTERVDERRGQKAKRK